MVNLVKKLQVFFADTKRANLFSQFTYNNEAMEQYFPKFRLEKI